MKGLLIAFAALQLVTGALLWVTPGFFHEEIGPFGTRNDHYMGDLGTWYLALGALVLASVRRAQWRVPLLALAVVQYALHSLNHLFDIGEADPSWLGPFTFVSVLLLTILLVWMLRSEQEAA
jgi:hypothetical protein